MPDRQPVRFATYRGDVRQILTDGAKGPTLMGEVLYPVTAVYDEESDRTRVGFSHLAPEDVAQ